MSTPLHVACAADERYAPYCAAMLHSLMLQHPDATVHFLHPPEFEAVAAAQLRRVVETRGGRMAMHAIDDARVAGLPAMRRIERIVWYRLFLPELVPDLARILYLDADTLVLDRLDALTALDLSRHHLAAVRNVMAREMRERLAAIGLPVQVPYFNSGVMVLNLDAWRRDDATARLLDLGRLHAGRFVFGDQDALNMLFQESCHWLHPRWNCQNSYDFWADDARAIFGADVVAEALQHPAILHFEGPHFLKPWHYLSRHPHKAAYWRALRASGYPMPKLEGLTALNFMHKHAPGVVRAVRAVRARLRRRP